MGEQRGLIQHGGAHDQPLLFSDLPERVMEHVESLERAGEWTGERLFSQNRQIYEAIVRMVAADFPDVTIAQLLKVSTNTVAGVRQREGESIEDQKKRMIPLMQRTKERLLQRIYETAPSLPGDRAAVAFGIVSDKLALESGAPTQRIEISTVPAVDDYRRWMESHVLDGCVQVAQTGCEGGVCGTKGAEAVVVSGVGEGGLDGGSAVAGDGRADRQSVVLQGESGDATGDATAADGGAGEVGGAGVDARDGGAGE